MISVVSWNSEVSYQARLRGFGSTEPLDVAKNGRRDRRHRIMSEFQFRLTRGVHATVVGAYATQTLNRELDLAATGDVADYSASMTSVSLRLSR